MDERAFYTESSVTRTLELNCPHCRTVAEYGLAWMLRRKRDRLPGHADERDRARFAKAQSYLVLQDDKVACSNLRCRKRFDVSGIKTMAFLSAEQEAELGPPPKQQQLQQRPAPSGNRLPPQRGQQQRQGQKRRSGQQQQAGPGGRRRGQQQDQQPGQQQGQPGQQQRQQKRKKKKRPEVYFPSDYVNYRP